jgi:putative MFS transporter
LIIALVALSASTPSIAETALVGGIPMALAAAAILFFGVETRNRPLEQITAEEFTGVGDGSMPLRHQPFANR